MKQPLRRNVTLRLRQPIRIFLSCHSLPVIREGHLLGVLTMDNVGEYIMVQVALRGTKTEFVPA